MTISKEAKGFEDLPGILKVIIKAPDHVKKLFNLIITSFRNQAKAIAFEGEKNGKKLNIKLDGFNEKELPKLLDELSSFSDDFFEQ